MPRPSTAACTVGSALLVGCLLGCGSEAPPAAEAPERSGESSRREAAGAGPNLLVILADDVGVDQVGITAGDDFAGRTPNIDRLGREGLVFERFWSMPACSPTRAALLTGLYPFRNGVGFVVDGTPAVGVSAAQGAAARPMGLPDDAFTLPRALAGAGYSSALLGKWHLGLEEEGYDHAERVGFDHFRGAFGNLPFGYFDWLKVVDGEQARRKAYATTDTTDDAIAMARELPEPWLIVVSYNAAHSPAHVPPQELHSFGTFDPGQRPRVAYRAMIEAMDTEIGRLVAAVAPRDPVVFFLGDNGPPQWIWPAGTKYRRGKGSLYEGGIHVPLVVHHRSIAAPGRRVAALAEVTDLFATLVELARAELPEERAPRDSASLAPHLRRADAPSAREWVFAESFWPNGWGARQREVRAVRDERFKLLRVGPAKSELYDLASDPQERRPLRARSPEATAALGKLARILADPPGVAEDRR
jgi:arylsulfatase A-like enzyme